MELYHLIANPDCAQVRKRIVELGLQDHVRFRNIAVSDEAAEDLNKLADGAQVPVLAIHGAVLTGQAAIVDYLEQVAKDPAFTLYPRFDELAGQVWTDVMGLIPDDLKAQVRGIRFLVEDRPEKEQLDHLEGEFLEHPEELCGLYQPPVPEEGIPAQVHLFRFALLDLLDPTVPEPEDVLKQEIAITLLHEVGHHFGLSEDDLDRLGYS